MNILAKTTTIATLFFLACKNAYATTPSSVERLPNYIAQGEFGDVVVQWSVNHHLHEKLPWFFAYTFRGFWLTEAPSKPIYEIDHMPELYALYHDSEVGYEHLSNGQGSQHDGYRGSRSLQRGFVAPHVKIMEGLELIPKFSAPIFYQTSSPVHDYIGHCDMNLRYLGNQTMASVAIRKGTRGGRIEVSYSFNPLTFLDDEFAEGNRTYLILTGFYGYAENLLDYDVLVKKIRIGIRFLL